MPSCKHKQIYLPQTVNYLPIYIFVYFLILGHLGHLVITESMASTTN